MSSSSSSKKQKVEISLKPRSRIMWTILVVVAVILVWRGIWNLTDIYLFPENPVVSNVLSIAIGILIIYLPNKNLKELL